MFQVGNGNMDHSFCCRAEEMSSDRPAYKLTPSKPGSDLTAEMAAAMAAGSLAFKSRGQDLDWHIEWRLSINFIMINPDIFSLVDTA